MEIEKIERFFTAGRQAWATTPDLVLSRRFFEEWETAEQPRPFSLPAGGALELAGQALTLAPDTDLIAHVTWDAAEMRPVLIVEGHELLQRVYLGFADGEPVLDPVDPALVQEEELGFGERLEVIYDVVEHVRRTRPGRHLLALTLREFREALEAISSRHSAQALRIMRRLGAAALQRFLRKAAEDMPADELSAQLELPLGGTYGPAVPPAALTPGLAPELAAVPGQLAVAGRTRWAVEQDVQFVAQALKFLAQVEGAMILDLRSLTVIEPGGERTSPVVAVASGGLPLVEGDSLQVFRRGERGPVSQLLIDLVDGTTLYGRLEWSAYDDALDKALPDLYAKPRGGPARFVAGCLEAFLARLRRDPSGEAPAVRAVLGLDDFCLCDPLPEEAPDGLDPSQVRAWRQAIAPGNPVVLIQGPPGTGKTSVLERVLRTLCGRGERVLLVAPANTAVDNACRRTMDLPVLRFGVSRDSIAPDIAEACWIGDLDCVRAFAEARRALRGGGLFAGTPVGLLRGEITTADVAKHGWFDVLVVDEAGMMGLDEFLLCCRLARRVVLFGDHQQLPPFPLPEQVIASLRAECDVVPRHLWATVRHSAIEWLVENRRVPVTVLQRSYRCQNPRLLRFSSTLFYNARVKPREDADYFKLPYAQRQARYPASTLRLYRTSGLPLSWRRERFVLEGNKPGIENELEARLCLWAVRDLLSRFPPREITVIAPYRRQVRLIRGLLERYREFACELAPEPPSVSAWHQFARARVSTVDSFQGGESDGVVVCYVRSNEAAGIGFVEAPNRVNVAHTRCRREMVVIADSECLCRQASSRLFTRMARAFERDGETVDVDVDLVSRLPPVPADLGLREFGLARQPRAPREAPPPTRDGAAGPSPARRTRC